MVKVVQCWDDAPLNDLRLTEMLRKYDAKATFNINPGLMENSRKNSSWVDENNSNLGYNYQGYFTGKLGLNEIKNIYSSFEVASHNWMHENAGIVPDEIFIESALKARHYLEDVFEKECKGFAWPGGTVTLSAAKLLKEANFAYARTTQQSNDVTNCPDTMQLAASCHFLARNFWDLYEQAKARNGVFYFWGHSYEMFEYDKLWEQLEIKIKKITNDPNAEWLNVIDIIDLCN